MPKLEKSDLLNAMAGYVLQNGLAAASLRPLAEAACTSDRMLIYHFGSKDQLIAELLQHLAAQMAADLDAALPATAARSDRDFLEEVVRLIRTPAFKPYITLSLEIGAGASLGMDSHRVAGRAIVDGFLAWTAARLQPTEPGEASAAALPLTLVEGVIYMEALGRTDIADLALTRLFALLDAKTDQRAG